MGLDGHFIHYAWRLRQGSFFCQPKPFSIRKQMSNHVCVTHSLNSIGNFYKAVGANEEALNYFQQTKSYADEYSLDYKLVIATYF